MRTQTKCLIALGVLGILGIGPLPTSTLIGFYVVLSRPPWFKELVLKLYAESESPVTRSESNGTTTSAHHDGS